MNLFFPFGWVTGAAAERVGRRIAELHQRAAAAAPGRRAIQWAGIARFCLKHGETGRALKLLRARDRRSPVCRAVR